MTSAALTTAAIPGAALLGQPTSAAAAVTGCPPTTTAAVPPPAKGPAIPKSGYLVEEIAERTYWLTDGLYQMIFPVTAEGVVAIDAPPTIGNNIARAIATVTKAQVTHAIYSHHHADHASAMTLYEGARFYAQREVTGLLRQADDPNRPLPDVTFDNELTKHQPKALAYPFHTFIGGHLTRLGTRDDVVIQQEYVAELKAAAANAIDTFNVGTVYASVDDTNPWAIFRGYLDGVAAQAAGAVVPRWTGKLGGADVYTQANAYQLVESLRIDYGHLGPFGIHP
jgi:hypothetical protein